MKRKMLTCLLLLALLLSACSAPQSPEEETASPVPVATLRAISLGTEPSGGLDTLYAALDALTIPELGCVLRFEYIPWGDERKQINLAIASGEFDFFPQGNFSDYQLMISRNAFLDIKPYLTLIPDLVAHYQQAGSDALVDSEIDGKLFGIPQYSAPGVNISEGFLYREDLRIKWGIEPVTSLETMEAYLYSAKADAAFQDKALITDNRIWNSLWSILTKDSYFEITGFTDTPYAVCAIDDPFQVVNRMETPEFRIMLEYLQKWYRDGILDKRLLTLSANEGTSGLMLFLNGDKPCETNNPLWSLNRTWLPQLTEAHPEWTYGFYHYDLGGRRASYKTGASQSSVLSISSRTKYPEIAVRLLEKLHTDQRYYDLLMFGVEGVHYERENDMINRENVHPEDRYVGWTAGADAFLDRPVKYCDNDLWTEQVYMPYLAMGTDLSEAATLHPLNDFHFNPSPVSAQAVRLEETWNTYMMPLLCGLAEDIDAELAEAMVRLEEAGLNEYLEEMQRQLTSFRQTKDMEE